MLLFVVSEEAWAVLVFPAWVFVVSAYLFAVSGREPEVAVSAQAGPASGGAGETGEASPA